MIRTVEQARQTLQTAVAHHQRGELKRAQKLYEALLVFQPQNADVLHLLGLVAADTGDHRRAADLLGRAVKSQPNNPVYHYNRGLAQQQIGQFDEAVECYDAALMLRPDYAEAHNNRGVALLALKRTQEAVASFERALSLKPDLDPGQYLHAKMLICDWRGIDENLRGLAATIAGARALVTPFAVLGLLDDPALHLKAAQTWMQSKHPAAAPMRTVSRQTGAKKKIRVGYYSADFHEHATSYLLVEVLEKHDRERFEILGFSYGQETNDPMRKRVSAAFDRFTDIRLRSDADVADLSARWGIDIAVDLKGLTADARTGIFAARCAPVQVNYLGYPGTIGAAHMDYIIADRVLIAPEEAKHFSEKIVYLPHSYQPNGSGRHIAESALTRAECGLPESGFVFCAFNNPYKITPTVFDSWMRILRAVDGAVLWLQADDPVAQRHLRNEAQARGVDTTRLVFAERIPLAEHLARQRLGDLFLDTLPYNAHTTGSDALWAGLPVLTLVGKSFAARVGASLLNAVGLPELVTETQDDYERRAIALATNADALGALRRKLHRERETAALFDSTSYARHLEAAYSAMHERAVASLPPAQIDIPAA